jgi:hypothetical protein
MTMFRVHLSDGTHVDVDAATPKAAADKVAANTGLLVKKTKVLRAGEA